MKIKIVCVGKIKESFFREAITEYSKRISKFANVEIIECQDEKTIENASHNEIEKVLLKEGERILNKINDSDYVIGLQIEGKKLNSEELADKISKICINGHNSICFVIGGSLGLSKLVKNRVDYSLSFSDMTFPHQLMRVVLLEQIYRSFKILNNEPYHK